MRSNVKVPLKLALPVVMGLVSTILMLWDIHNQRVIMSMGMDWDTGAPLWPHQTPDTLLFALDTPAFLFPRLGLIGPLRYVMLLPAIVAWWWLVGLYLDHRLASRSVRKTTTGALLFCLLAVGLLFLGVEESRWALRWWWTYSREVLSVTDLIFLRAIAPSIWCFVLSLVALSAARRRMRI